MGSGLGLGFDLGRGGGDAWKRETGNWTASQPGSQPASKRPGRQAGRHEGRPVHQFQHLPPKKEPTGRHWLAYWLALGLTPSSERGTGIKIKRRDVPFFLSFKGYGWRDASNIDFLFTYWTVLYWYGLILEETERKKIKIKEEAK